ncbi:unnamed protein product [Allacma fusca]|uniref:Ricin B lectin domain-containing protein n=1 Tax=Allacma fusca TaxID=39272 RepID=A0A8J2LPL4_9HEXA|nr:unnamed protein product [Allacma fusca]
MSQEKFRFRSFACGVILASCTWIAVMYLYWNIRGEPLLEKDTHPGHEGYVPLRQKFTFLQQKEKQYFKDNVPSWKAKFRKLIGDQETYRNSDLLISQLSSQVRVLPDAQESQVQLGLVKTVEEKRMREDGYRKYAFNALISSRLGNVRNITDTRHDKCSGIRYPGNLPRASVIICFYNEEYHALLRTVHSVLERSNPNSLHEILLIDDFSDHENLHYEIANYAKKNLPVKVTVLKTPNRAGLIRARIFGARHATGDVLVFLDSHVEPNVNWLDPLLAPIKEDRKTVTTPIIDIINADTFAYTRSPLVKGGFNWGLHFRWDNVPRSLLKTRDDFVRPIVSPTMAGGLFAIKKDYFIELGEYDDGMEVWGGENVELSFRLWCCGGRLVIIPCSRVGHVFRRRRPYGASNGEDTTLRNSVRVAEVWLDEFKEYFYKAKPEAKSVDFGDVSSRVTLRKELNCKPFKWYIDNIYPDILTQVPVTNQSGDSDKNKKDFKSKFKSMQYWRARKRSYNAQFQLNLVGTKLCAQSEKPVMTKNSELWLQRCTDSDKKQRWFESEKHELVLAEMLCLNADDDKPRLAKCHELLGNQEWQHSLDTNTTVYNLAVGQCLGVKAGEKPKIGTKLTMEICSSSNKNLRFDLINYRDLS